MSCATFGGGVSSSHCAEWDLRRLWLYECACWLVCGAWDMGDGSVGPCVVCPWGRDEWICILVGGDPQCPTLVTVFVAGRRSLWPGGTCCFALGDRSCWPRGRLGHMSLCFPTSVCSYNVAVLGVHHGARQGSELVGSFAAGERTSGALGAETGWFSAARGSRVLHRLLFTPWRLSRAEGGNVCDARPGVLMQCSSSWSPPWRCLGV